MNYKYNLPHKNIPRQAKINKDFLYCPKPSQYNLNHCHRIFEKESPSVQRFMEYLLRYWTKYKNLYMSEETIAAELGYKCTKTISRAIKVLKQLGFISVWFRPYKTNYYRISDCFKRLDVRKKLMDLFPILAPENAFIFLLLSQPAIIRSNEHCPTILLDKLSFSSSLSSYLSLSISQSSLRSNTSNESSCEDALSTKVSRKKETMSVEHSLIELNFTEEQLVLLAQYPHEIIEVALTRYHKVNDKSPIKAPFKYFESICKNLLREQLQQKLSGNARKQIDSPSSDRFLKITELKQMIDDELKEFEEKITLWNKKVISGERLYEQYPTIENAKDLQFRIAYRDKLLKQHEHYLSTYGITTPQRERQCIEPNAQHYVYANELGAVMPDKVKEELLMKVSRDATLLESNPVLKIILEEYLRRRKTISNPATSC